MQSDASWTLGDNLERLTLLGTLNISGTGNALANILTGNDGRNLLSSLDGRDSLVGGGGIDTLDGGLANDTLNGGLGSDSMIGGAGADIFVFDSALSTTTNRDYIAEFTAGSDKIQLDDDVFTALTGGSPLTAAQFASGAGLVAAQTVDQRIFYNTNSGALYYDADGSDTGFAAVQFAVLMTKPLLSASDFLIVV